MAFGIYQHGVNRRDPSTRRQQYPAPYAPPLQRSSPGMYAQPMAQAPYIPSMSENQQMNRNRRNDFSETMRQGAATQNAINNGRLAPPMAPPMTGASPAPAMRQPGAGRSPAPMSTPQTVPYQTPPIGIAPPMYNADEWDPWMKIRKGAVDAAEQAPWQSPVGPDGKATLEANPAIEQSKRDYADAATSQSNAFQTAQGYGAPPKMMPVSPTAPNVDQHPFVQAPMVAPQQQTQAPGMTGRTAEQRQFEQGYAERERARAAQGGSGHPLIDMQTGSLQGYAAQTPQLAPPTYSITPGGQMPMSMLGPNNGMDPSQNYGFAKQAEPGPSIQLGGTAQQNYSRQILPQQSLSGPPVNPQQQAQAQGQQFTDDDLLFTAQKHGITTDEVRRRLGM